MEDDRLILLRYELLDERDRPVDQLVLERPSEEVPAVGKLLGPALRLDGEQPKGMLGRGRPPQTQEHAGRQPVRLVLVERPELRPGRAVLDQESAPLRVVGEQADGALTVPVLERVRLVFAVLVGIVDLEDGLRPVREGGGRHERDVRRLERRPDAERPPVGAFGDQPGQALEPGGASLLVPPPFEPARELQTG